MLPSREQGEKLEPFVARCMVDPGMVKEFSSEAERDTMCRRLGGGVGSRLTESVKMVPVLLHSSEITPKAIDAIAGHASILAGWLDVQASASEIVGEFELIELDPEDESVTFLSVPGFDLEDKPSVAASYRVNPKGDVLHLEEEGRVIESKKELVSGDYPWPKREVE